MKKNIILVFSLFFSAITFSQNSVSADIKFLKSENEILRLKVENLQLKLDAIEKRFVELEKQPFSTPATKASTSSPVPTNTKVNPAPATKQNSVSSGGRCKATTKAGTQCKRTSSGSSGYCWQHQ